MGGYESHLTFRLSDAETVRTVGPRSWKYSQIDGDPVLGKRAFCYLTAHGYDEIEMVNLMISTAQLMRTQGAPPVRMKLERIVYDHVFSEVLDEQR